MPKTGSLSMMQAYQRLGLQTYHGFDFIENDEHQVQWKKAIDAKFYGKGKPFTKADFDAFLGDYSVISDFPFIGFWEEFLEWYPEARVVIVERDVDDWFHSFDTHIIGAGFAKKAVILRCCLEPLVSARPATAVWNLERALFNCHDRQSFSNNAKSTYLKHYEKVRSIVPKERLLDYKLGSGWEPLCQFLGKPVPVENFPWSNERKEFEERLKNIAETQFRKAFQGLKKSPLRQLQVAIRRRRDLSYMPNDNGKLIR
jgi:hypothetical protein